MKAPGPIFKAQQKDSAVYVLTSVVFDLLAWGK